MNKMNKTAPRISWDPPMEGGLNLFFQRGVFGSLTLSSFEVSGFLGQLLYRFVDNAIRLKLLTILLCWPTSWGCFFCRSFDTIVTPPPWPTQEMKTSTRNDKNKQTKHLQQKLPSPQKKHKGFVPTSWFLLRVWFSKVPFFTSSISIQKEKHSISAQWAFSAYSRTSTTTTSYGKTKVAVDF